MSTPENTILRLSGDLYAYRITAAGEDKGIGPLAANLIEVQAQADVKRAMDTRRGRRGQTIQSIADPKQSTGGLELITVPPRLLAMLLLGDVRALNETSGSVVDEAVTHETGYWTDLAHRHISNLVLTSADGLTTYTEGTDYEVNARIGAYRPLEGGAMAASADAKASYDYGAVTGDQVVVGTNTQVRCRLLLDGVDDVSGQDVIWRAHSALLTPDGAIDLASADPVTAKFKLEFETPSGYDHATSLEWPHFA